MECFQRLTSGKRGKSFVFFHHKLVMEESKGVRKKLERFIEMCRCFKERLIDIRRWAGGFVEISHGVNEAVGDVGT
jgi:hypothetical protein